MRNPYTILGLGRGGAHVTDAEIRKAYLRKALVLHPDKRPAAQRSVAETEFKELQRCYKLLCDKQARRAYDGDAAERARRELERAALAERARRAEMERAARQAQMAKLEELERERQRQREQELARERERQRAAAETQRQAKKRPRVEVDGAREKKKKKKVKASYDDFDGDAFFANPSAPPRSAAAGAKGRNDADARAAMHAAQSQCHSAARQRDPWFWVGGIPSCPKVDAARWAQSPTAFELHRRTAGAVGRS